MIVVPINRRRFLQAMSASFIVVPFAADAQAPKKIPTIGVLAPGTRGAHVDRTRAFWQGMIELGYVEGQNIAVERRSSEGHDERARSLASELVQRSVDVIVAGSTAEALAAKQATSTIPIVFVGIGDPVARGLVASVARPGGNVTGIGFFAGPEVNSKRLELLLQAAPGVSRVAVLRYRSRALQELPRSSQDVLRDAAHGLRVKLQVLHMQDPDDLEGAFAAMKRERAEAVLPVASPFFSTHRERLLALVARSRLPAIYADRAFVEPGGLMSYGENLNESHRRAARYVDKILRGARPADLPVEQATRLELVISLKTAQAIGLTIPPSVLARADEVIQ